MKGNLVELNSSLDLFPLPSGTQVKLRQINSGRVWLKEQGLGALFFILVPDFEGGMPNQEGFTNMRRRISSRGPQTLSVLRHSGTYLLVDIPPAGHGCGVCGRLVSKLPHEAYTSSKRFTLLLRAAYARLHFCP